MIISSRTHLWSAWPVPPERGGGRVAVGAPASGRGAGIALIRAGRADILPAVAAGHRLPRQPGRRRADPGLGAPGGRRAERERAVDGAAVGGVGAVVAALLAVVVVVPRRRGEQHGAAAAAAAVEQPTRAWRRLVQHLD